MSNHIPIRGRIAVYSDRHRLLDSRIYYTSDGMKVIMAHWMTCFPDGFYIQVQPYSKDHSHPKKSEKIRLDIPAKKIERPSSKYTNLPGYDYGKTKNGQGH